MDTDATGAFTLTLQVAAGDTLELLRSRRSLAYVVTRGVGVEVVDLTAFYNETPEDPNTPSPESDVLGIYTGYQDPSLRLCNEPVSDLGSAILDLGTLFDGTPGHPHPLTLVGLVGFRGLALLESDPADVGEVSFFNEACLEIEGSARVAGLEVLEDYRFDLDGDGRLEEEEERDYLLVAHLTKGVLILDATDRDRLELVGRIKLPGQAAHLGVDRANRRLYVAASGAGIFVLDLDSKPTTVFQDANQDGLDDRVLETIPLDGGTNAPVFLVPELGIAYAGGVDRGLTSITVGEPRLVAVTEAAGAEGGLREVTRLAPHGVPTAPESSAEGAADLPGSFRVLAHLPGASGAEVRLDVVALGTGGVEIRGAGGPTAIPGLPPAALEAADGLLLRRLSDNPLDEGYQVYLSEEVAALADLRASAEFDRTAREDEQCERCDLPDGAREVLSGHSLAVRFPGALRATLGPLYGAARLDAAELELASVPWETSPSTRQEPALNPSYGTGDAAPGTLLHSGEYSHAATDLAVKSRGFDLAFSRTYRSQTVGNGPLGPGWDFGYAQRLRELPNGDVEYYDGRGRREIFTKKAGEDGSYEAPAGRFVELSRTSAGWVWIDARKNQRRFDRFGRLVAIADAVKDSAETGNEMRFHHDAAGHLVEIEDTLERSYHLDYDEEGRLTTLTDFTGREVSYEYDPEGRLVRVLSPEVTTGLESPGRLTTTYAYEPGSGTLATTLTTRDNLTAITDARGVEWLTNTYTDADGDGR
ncbi:MAG TPA: DUF6531 domain-containing protein, partial [Thermoanaerobaculia bacterium]|nr:DUF6531 domain-containing protein [Thermoanaerobaculia bacterium]